MDLYYLLWILSMIIMSLPCKTNSGYRAQLISCMALLFCFGAFRLDFGLDYKTYEAIFDGISKEGGFVYDPNERNEIGYMFLNYLCPSFRFLLVITSLLVCIAYYSLFDRYIPRRYRLLGIFLLYLCGNNTVFFMFSGIRNSITISILILSLPLILKRKLLPFAIWTAIAWSVHTSALIVFPVAYAMGSINKITKKTAIIMIGVALLLFVIPFDILLGVSANFISSYFDRYSTYIDKVSDLGVGASLLVSLPNIIFITAIVLTFMKAKSPNHILEIVLVGVLAFYFPLLGLLDMRLSIYVSAIGIASIILTYSHIKDQILRNSLMSLFIIYKGYAFFMVFLNNPYFTYSQIHNLLFE